MALRIHTNIAALTAQHHLLGSTQELGTSLRRLSSGLRIERARDDAAALGISERMRSRIRSLAVAERNARDGDSMARTADGALAELTELISEARELAMAASNGVLAPEDRQSLVSSHRSGAVAMRRLLEESNFNGMSLLNGGQEVLLQVGLDSDQHLSLQLPDLENVVARFEGETLATPEGASAMLTLADELLPVVTGARASLGASMNRLSSVQRSLRAARENESAAESRIRDVDVADESARMTRASILQQAAVAVLSQANAQPSLALDLIG